MRKLTLPLVLLASVVAVGLGARALAQSGADRQEALEQARDRLEQAAEQLAEADVRIDASSIEEAIESAMTLVQGIRFGARRAMLGIVIDDEQDGQGVVIGGVSPGGPAENAGLRSGDLLLSVDGVALAEDDQHSPTKKLLAFMQDIEPGQSISVEYRRDNGGSAYADVVADKLGSRMAVAFGDKDFTFDFGGDFKQLYMLDHFHSRWGDMELVELNPALGSYFGTERGLLVVRAPADDAISLQDGDVIVAIDGREPKNSAHALKILRTYEGGDTLNLSIYRQQSPMQIRVELPKGDGYSNSSYRMQKKRPAGGLFSDSFNTLL